MGSWPWGKQQSTRCSRQDFEDELAPYLDLGFFFLFAYIKMMPHKSCLIGVCTIMAMTFVTRLLSIICCNFTLWNKQVTLLTQRGRAMLRIC